MVVTDGDGEGEGEADCDCCAELGDASDVVG